MRAEEPGETGADVIGHITVPGRYCVEWEYSRGAHGVKLEGTGWFRRPA